MRQIHLTGQFLAKAKQMGDAPLFFDKLDGHWQAVSYEEAAARVSALAHNLQRMGLEQGERVILCAENSSSWAICDLAILAAGGIVVPAYTTHTPRDHIHQLEDSGASFIICSDSKAGARLMEVAKNKKQIKAAIILSHPGQTAKNSPLQQSAAFPIHPVEEIWQPKKAKLSILGGGQETCCIIYTSGTGGQPKGVMLSHSSIQANVDAAYALLEEGQAAEEAVFLSLAILELVQRTVDQKD